MEVLKTTWALLSSSKETDLQEKWFAVNFTNKKKKGQLLIAKLQRRFLFDEGGEIESLEMRCLKPKVGYGNILDDTPDNLPDIGQFKLHDVLQGPLDVAPKFPNKFTVANYEQIVNMFDRIQKCDWKNI